MAGGCVDLSIYNPPAASIAAANAIASTAVPNSSTSFIPQGFTSKKQNAGRRVKFRSDAAAQTLVRKSSIDIGFVLCPTPKAIFGVTEPMAHEPIVPPDTI